MTSGRRRNVSVNRAYQQIESQPLTLTLFPYTRGEGRLGALTVPGVLRISRQLRALTAARVLTAQRVPTALTLRIVPKVPRVPSPRPRGERMPAGR